MMMWQVSAVAWAPTMRLQLITLEVKGALFLYVLTGTVDWSQYGVASRKFWVFSPPLSAVSTADLCGEANGQRN